MNTMTVILAENGTVWHEDCPQGRGRGIIGDIAKEETQTLVKCYSCGAKGYIKNNARNGYRGEMMGRIEIVGHDNQS